MVGDIMKLLEPIIVNKVKFRTHTLMPAMHTGMVKGFGEITDTFTNFYLERAKNDIGLIIVGGCRIGPLAAPLNMIALDDDKFIPGLQEFTSKMHNVGAPVAAQLYHGGAYVHSFSMLPEVKASGAKALAPSAIYSKFTKETPKEMTIDEIKTAIDEFATAAQRAKEAGFDEIQTRWHDGTNRVYGYRRKVSQGGICKAGLSVPSIK